MVLWFACARPEPPPHEAYLWQRQWTDAVRQGAADAAADFAGIRVNAASVATGGVVEHPVDLAALAGPVRPVVRVDAGALPGADVLQPLLQGLVDRWRAAGLEVVGAELDHDCPTSQLAAYAEVVRAVRLDVPLSVTALPTWSDSHTLDALVSAADAVVLQVHAVDDPALGLFDPARARAAIAAFAPRAPHLWVALPAYGLRLADGRELRVDPAAVRSTLAALTAFDLEGIVWFRAPVPGDPRGWSRAALAAVRRGEIPRGVARVTVTPSGTGAYDLRLVVDGPIWTPRPTELRIVGACGLADAVAGYAVSRSDGLALIGPPGLPLDPGPPLPVGWVRCEAPPTVEAR